MSKQKKKGDVGKTILEIITLLTALVSLLDKLTDWLKKLF